MIERENQVIYDELLGEVLKDIKVNNVDEEIEFTMKNGKKYLFYHEQDCCEDVYIEDIAGKLEDLIGEPITMAHSCSEVDYLPKNGNSGTWTFYKFATIKGYVTIRWYGESNGYYSESVDFKRCDEEHSYRF